MTGFSDLNKFSTGLRRLGYSVTLSESVDGLPRLEVEKIRTEFLPRCGRIVSYQMTEDDKGRLRLVRVVKRRPSRVPKPIRSWSARRGF